jgi:hypothetical protein
VTPHTTTALQEVGGAPTWAQVAQRSTSKPASASSAAQDASAAVVVAAAEPLVSLVGSVTSQATPELAPHTTVSTQAHGPPTWVDVARLPVPEPAGAAYCKGARAVSVHFSTAYRFLQSSMVGGGHGKDQVPRVRKHATTQQLAANAIKRKKGALRASMEAKASFVDALRQRSVPSVPVTEVNTASGVLPPVPDVALVAMDTSAPSASQIEMDAPPSSAGDEAGGGGARSMPFSSFRT